MASILHGSDYWVKNPIDIQSIKEKINENPDIHPHDKSYIEAQLMRVSAQCLPIVDTLFFHYSARINRNASSQYSSRHWANCWIRETIDQIKTRSNIKLAFLCKSDCAELAKLAAKHCFDQAGEGVPFNEKAPLPYGIDYDSVTGKTNETKNQRVSQEKWWRRRIERLCNQTTELINYDLEIVKAEKNEYCSTWNTKRRISNKQAEALYLENTFIGTKDGKTSLKLADIAKKPEHKIAELYTAAKGLEKIQKTKGYSWIFVTVSCPPEFHPNPAKGKRSWDRELTPKDSSQHLQGGWARTRAQTAKNGIEMFGIWSKEPHKDGCPHMHALIYAHSDDLEQIEKNLRNQFGQSDQAVKVVKPDGRATPTTYILKYLMKAVGCEQAPNKKGQIENHDSVEAASALWGYRKYGFFGVKSSLGLWRELRRTADLEESEIPENIKRTRQNAIAGDFERFVLGLYDGVELLKEEFENQYGETQKKVIGIIDANTGEGILTHKETWVTLKPNYPRAGSADSKEKPKTDHLYELRGLPEQPRTIRTAK